MVSGFHLIQNVQLRPELAPVISGIVTLTPLAFVMIIGKSENECHQPYVQLLECNKYIYYGLNWDWCLSKCFHTISKTYQIPCSRAPLCNSISKDTEKNKKNGFYTVKISTKGKRTLVILENFMLCVRLNLNFNDNGDTVSLHHHV